MRIDGEWALLDDDVMRPIVTGDIKASNDLRAAAFSPFELRTVSMIR
jgi:hypothetical protein